MHLADGTLANQVCTVTTILSAASVAHAITRVRSHATPRRLFNAGVGATLVFLAQMIDVPLFGGVGVHLIGAALLTLLAGPVLALLAMTTVIATQAFALNDGGVTTLGANVMNMGVIGVGSAYAMISASRVHRFFAGSSLLVIAAASASSVLLAATAMTIELAFSGGAARESAALTLSAHAPFALLETGATVVLAVVAARLRVIDTSDVPARAAG